MLKNSQDTKNKASKINKKKGGKLSRTEVVQVRLSARLRYGTEIAARAKKRTLSSLIEWSVENSLNDINVSQLVDKKLFTDKGKSPPQVLPELLSAVWHIDEAVRFTRLARAAPLLLSSEEELIWDFICNEPLFWKDPPRTSMRRPFTKLISAMWGELQDYVYSESFDKSKLIEHAKQVLDPSRQAKLDQIQQLWNDVWTDTDNNDFGDDIDD